MNTTITIKTEKKLRDKAKQTAKELGIPLTTAMNAMLRQFVRDRSVTISLEPRVRPEKLAEWNRISEEIKKHPERTKSFSDVEDLISHLGLER